MFEFEIEQTHLVEGVQSFESAIQHQLMKQKPNTIELIGCQAATGVQLDQTR